MVMFILLIVPKSSSVKCSAFGNPSEDGIKALFASGSSDTDAEVLDLCMCPCVWSGGGSSLLPSLLSVLPPEGAQTFQLGGFMSFLSPPPQRAFILLWRRRRGFQGESYKCPSGGTEGTSLFPSARKLSSERRQSSAWWES